MIRKHDVTSWRDLSVCVERNFNKHIHESMRVAISIFLWLTEDQEQLKPGLGGCGWVLTLFSWLLIGLTFPVSLCVCLKVSLQCSLYGKNTK